MPSKSEKQKKFMTIAAHDPKFAKKAGISQKVAKEFHQADKKNESEEFRDFLNYLFESENPANVASLSYDPKDIKDFIHQDAWDLHFNKLYKGYVNKFNDGDSSEFTEGGYVLHELYFTQFTEKQNSKKTTKVMDFIDNNFDSYENFQSELIELCLSLQGSGWVYLSKSGNLKTIKNHSPKNDIVLIVDMWEHAFVQTFGTDKEKYVKELLKHVNWDFISQRLMN